MRGRLLQRFIGILLAGVIMFSAVPAALAQEFADLAEDAPYAGEIEKDSEDFSLMSITSGDWSYSENSDGTITIAGYAGSETQIEIPEMIDNLTVTGIGSKAFYNNTVLTGVTIPESVTVIDENAFYGCSNLNEIIIPNNVTTVGNYAFRGCSSLASVRVGSSVTSIGYGAFNGCGALKGVYISDLAAWCNIDFKSNGTSWPAYTANPLYFAGNLYINEELAVDIVIPSEIEKIKTAVFAGCTSLESVTIEEGTASIGSYAFSGCASLKSVVIPDGVTSIGSYAFDNCALLSAITIPDSVESIGNYAFADCSALESAAIGSKTESIGNYAFSGCASLKSITIPDEVTSLGSHAFYNCSSAAGLTIGSGVASIGEYAFYGCASLISVTIPDNVETIGNYAFRSCTSLACVVFGSGVTSIGYGSFNGCGALKGVYISDLAAWCGIDFKSYGTSWPAYTANPLYYGGNLYINNELAVGLVIPDGIEKIKPAAFAGCTSIESVTMADSVTSIGSYAFYKCKSLDSVNISGGAESVGSYAFSGCTALTDVTMTDGVTSIGSYAFSGCTALTDVTMADGVTSIGSYAFSGCTALVNLEMANSVTSIGSHAFYNCAALVNVIVPKNAVINEYAFYNCTSLVGLTISEGVVSIDDYAFGNCKSLKALKIPDSVTEMGEYVFSGCTALLSVNVGDGLTGINRSMFSGCTALSSVVLSDNITSLENSSFYGCSALEEIELPAGLLVLASSVFLNTGLKSVVVPESVTGIGTSVFPQNTLLYVYPGSAADDYAQTNGYSYEYIFGDKTSVTLYDESGEKISDGYSVKWYAVGSDTPISEEKNLYAEEAEYYYAEISFDETASFLYRQPSRVKAAYGENVDVIVDCINTITLKMTLLCDADVTAEIKQVSGGFTKSFTLQPDENGALTIEAANVTTSVKISADGYYSVTKYPIVGYSKSDTVDLGETELVKIENRKIYVKLSVASAGTEDAKTTSLTGFDGVEFELYDETAQKYVEALSVEYPYIVIEEDIPNDEIVVYAKAENTATSSAKAADTEKGYDLAEIVLKENGKIRAGNISSNKSISAFIFDESGALVQRIVTSEGSFTTNALPDGTYTVVVTEKNTLFKNFGSISQLERYTLSEGEDYFKAEAVVSAGSISEIEAFEVPTLDVSKFSYTVEGSAKVEVNKTEVTEGDYVTVKVSYEIEDQYEPTNEKVYIELPENVVIAEGSVTLDGKSAAYTTDDEGRIVIVTNKSSGAVRFYVSAEAEGSFAISAALSFENTEKSFIQSIGTAAFYAAEMFITLPNNTATKMITVSGSTRANAEITIYDGKTVIGSTRANANGSWMCDAELNYCSKYSNHTIYAVAELADGSVITSEKQNVFYNPDAPEVSKVTMHSRGGTVTFDFQNPSLSGSHYSFWYEYPEFTFTITFVNDIPEDSEVYLNVYGNMDVISVKTNYDAENKRWVASMEVEEGFLPVNVEVSVKSYSTRENEAGEVVSTYSYSVNDINEMAKTAQYKYDISDEAVEKSEAIDSIYGIYNIDGTLVAMETGYVAYSADDIGSVSFGLENESFDEIALEDGGEMYLYTGYEDGVYVRQLIADCDTALKLNGIFDETVCAVIAKNAEYAAFTTVSLIGLSDEGVDETRNLFAALGESAAAATDDAETMTLKGLGDAVWGAMSDASNSLYVPSQIFVEYMKTVNTLTDNFETLFTGNLKQEVLNASKFALNTAGDSISDAQAENIYKMYQNIDVTSPYFQEATELINAYDNLSTTAENIGIVSTAGEFLAKLFGKEGLSDAVSALGDLATIGDMSKTNVIYEMMKRLAEKEQQRKNNNGQDPDNPNPDDPEDPQPDNPSNRPSGGGDNPFNHTEKYPGDDMDYCIDPSGYVYEAVPSNRVEGVSVTAYTKEEVSDSFGEPTGEYKAVMWDAEDYDQINPLISDANGKYAWDVPEGQWQVKFEKDGYETAYSEWLPVPPPQTEVNVGIVSLEAPEVKAVSVYSDSIRIEFTQYMTLDSVNTGSVIVYVGGNKVSGTVESVNAEENYEKSAEYASIFTFIPESAISGAASVEVKGAVNYAGKSMQSTYTTAATVVPAPTGLEAVESVSVGYNSSSAVEVTVLEGDAGKNMTLKAVSSSPEIVSVVNETAVTDEEGKAIIVLSGNLPGSGEITVTIDGTDIERTINATVGTPASAERCGKVTASVESGSVVKKGTVVELESSTSGSTIYYTTDGTDPTESATRILYGEAIEITADTVIIAYAEKDGMDASATAGFAYTLEKEKTLTASVTIALSGEVQGQLIAAAYDEEGVMLFARMFDAEKVSGEVLTLEEVLLSDVSKLNYIKIFQWNADGTMQPIADVTEAEIIQ